MSGKLYGIGVGPGDPELITLKAKRILNSVQCIALPKTAGDKESLALAIARGVIGQEKEVMELLFPMSYETAVLEKSRQEAAGKIRSKLDEGSDIAFITLGDPTIYSTYMYLRQSLQKQGYATEVVPGITSFCAAAARAGISLGETNETIAIVPAVYECQNLDEILSRFDTVILMKVAHQFAGLKARLQEQALTSNAVVISRCGLPGEKIELKLDDVAEEALGYLTTVIIKKARELVAEDK